MSRFKTYPINKDPNWKYRSSSDTDIRHTIDKARKAIDKGNTLVMPALEVDEVQDAKAPHNVRSLRFARRSS